MINEESRKVTLIEYYVLRWFWARAFEIELIVGFFLVILS